MREWILEGKSMYWLLDYDLQEKIRIQIMGLQSELNNAPKRGQKDQTFPFVGRKNRNIAKIIIRHLLTEDGVVCDPFCGSGTFAYAALDCDKRVIANEWEPYANRMSTAPFRGVPPQNELNLGLEKFKKAVLPTISKIYRTKCPNCGNEIMFDGLFFDRNPEEYYNPTEHERMGNERENVIFRQKYKCVCGCKEKQYDDYDEEVRKEVEAMVVDFPNSTLIENSRLNFTAPEFVQYQNMFSKRQQIALTTIYNAIENLDNNVRTFFEDAFFSIIQMAKYTDYRSKSQDNHCPEIMLKENNIYYRFLEKLEDRKSYINDQNFANNVIECMDFRDFLSQLDDKSIDLFFTDPPYGDNAQYFEHAQRVHPFMDYDLSKDNDRLSKEVVISNAKSRTDKHSKQQFMKDIETLLKEAARVTKTHGYVVLYFRPEQRDWITDLNTLKHFARKYGLEPLISIPIDNNDPSMRALASAAWTFKNDVCFIFLRLSEEESRWYEQDTDVDELIYLAAKAAATEQGNPFILSSFNREMLAQFRRSDLLKLAGANYSQKIMKILERYTIKQDAQFRLNGLSPYELMNRDMNAEVRLREFAPIVIEELTDGGRGFTFEEYVIHLSSFMENGSREIIEKLHTANRLVPELLSVYAKEDKEKGLFFAIELDDALDVANDDRIEIRTMDPSDFEKLIGEYFERKGYSDVKVIGRSCDRGVDILVTNIEGKYELVQCKRYRKGNNIGSTPIQRIDSYMRTRHAVKAWVITTSDFTVEGKDEARITGVIAVNGDELINSLEVYFPGKYRL